MRRPVDRNEALWFAGITLVLAASIVWHPPDDGGFVVCLFHRVTGLPCMGCGLTRSFCAMGKGEVGRAAGFHALGPAAFLVACLYWARGAAALAGRTPAVARFDAAVRRWRLLPVAFAVFLAAWAVRLVLLVPTWVWSGEWR